MVQTPVHDTRRYLLIFYDIRYCKIFAFECIAPDPVPYLQFAAQGYIFYKIPHWGKYEKRRQEKNGKSKNLFKTQEGGSIFIPPEVYMLLRVIIGYANSAADPVIQYFKFLKQRSCFYYSLCPSVRRSYGRQPLAFGHSLNPSFVTLSHFNFLYVFYLNIVVFLLQKGLFLTPYYLSFCRFFGSLIL